MANDSLSSDELSPEIRDFLVWLIDYAKTSAAIDRVILFGSFARGDQGVNSDIDLAFTLKDQAFWPDVKKAILQNPVTLRRLDLIDLASVGQEFKDKINAEGKRIYG